MTAARALIRGAPFALGEWAAIGVLLAGLGAIVAGRWVAIREGVDGLVVGAAFGVLLLVLAASVSGRHVRRAMQAAAHPGTRVALGVAWGVAFGLVLVGIAILGPALAGATTAPGLGRPATPFLAWAAVTIVVASAEEVLLRGVLLDRVGRVVGIVPAIIVTSGVFALMHVPLYGWHVVPLDLAVGLGLAGLRLATRSLVAPATAHAVADLATWWL